MRRLLVLILLALGAIVLAPLSATAHDVVESTSPGEGTTVETMPSQVTLTMSDDPIQLGTQVLVKGPAGNVAQGDASVDGRVVTQRVSPDAPAGDYVVTYRVTSNDGHPISGTFSFHATVGLDGSTATQGASVPLTTPDPPAGETSQVVPIVLTIVGAVVVLGIILGAWLAMRRKQASRS
jgi:methionine-rich copper-binding protein CopC